MMLKLISRIRNYLVQIGSTTVGYPLVIECSNCEYKTIKQDFSRCPQCESEQLDRYRVETYVD